MSAKLLRYISVITFLVLSVTSFGKTKPILDIKKWTTQSGTPVFYVQEKELPMVDIQVVFDAGSARDFNKPGLAKMTNEVLSSGTNTKTVDQIASAFEDIGARYSSAVSRDMAAVALRSLSDPKFLKPAVNTFSDVLTQPNFPEKEFLRIQKQLLNSLDEQEEQPSTIAAKAFYNAVYDNNPYGHPISGNKDSVSKLTVNDLRDFYKNLYTAKNALIAIVGDIDETEAKQLAENISSHLNQGAKVPGPKFIPYVAKSPFQHIVFPSSQTHILIGQEAINRNNPEYFQVMVGNYILGGGTLTSRLFDEVREKRGLAYSVRSQFNTLKDKGPFIIELQTRNSEANNAIKVVNDTLSKFIAVGPTPQELEAAKQNLTQGFILRLASNSAIIGQLVNIGYYQLPLDYLDTYRGNILNVSDQQIRSAFQHIIQPAHLVTVTVGNTAVATTDAKKSSKE